MDLRIVIEDKVPFAHGLLESVGAQVMYMPAGAIDSDVMRDADALITRTRTRCDARLLAGSRCSMIASATIGLDHVDIPWCEGHGVEVANAPGCNAPAVAQYVLCSLALLGREPRSTTLGIVGVGHVGSIVERWARSLGYRVMLCDPPRARREGSDGFSSLVELAREADVITFHTPLTRSGDDATYHLADQNFFASLLRKPVIVNSARGSVVDTAALIDALRSGLVSHAVVDCWEGEPAISRELLALASIATSHIAGYSRQGKTRATAMAVAAVCRHFGLPLPAQTPPLDPVADTVTPEVLTASYDPMADTRRLKENPQSFENFRNNYDLRSEPCIQ